MMDENTAVSLRILLSATDDTIYSTENIPLTVTFVNLGGEALRLLCYFDPLPVFFAFDMMDEDGRYVAIPKAGKIDIYDSSLPYIKLGSGEDFAIEVNLAGILAYPEDMHSGMYTVTATYHNQYGEDCFRGIVNSNSVSILLVSESSAGLSGPVQ
jgi:hypothetical protein